MKRKSYILAIALVTAGAATAQTITFDTDDYKSVSVYDSWVDSPFRTGDLKGNAQVIANHLTDESELLGYAPNTTSNIAALQRSRYGGNLFGLRVDLNETFRLTKEERYVHVLINRPVDDSRAMLITLGKRTSWTGQSEEVEQTWSLSSTTVGKDGWYDAVFTIKGFSYEDTDSDGIDIYSLVICPDVTNRCTLGEDFACYIDQIEINSVATARFNADYYPINFDKETEVTRTDRMLNSVAISGSDDGTQSYTDLSSYIYNDGTQEPAIFSAAAGDVIQPTFNYTGSWMDGYVYVDYGQDGKFSYDINDDGTPADGSDLVSYNAYMPSSTWYKSDGTTVSNGNQIGNGVPSFTIPEDTEEGLYRMRFKVDWNSIDPGGNTNESNLLVNNGGGIADILLNVYPSQCTVTASQLNGDIYPASDTSTPLNGYKVSHGSKLRIKVVPADGFTYTGIRVRYGYNLDQDSVLYGNPQYFDTYYSFSEFSLDELTLPASILSMGEVLIEGYMVEGEHVAQVDSTAMVPIEVNSLNGRIIGRQTYADGTLSYTTGVPEETTPFKFLGLVAQPLVDGYECDSVTIRHGWDLDGDQFNSDSVRLWSEWKIALPETGRINIPKDSVYGNLRITADFELTTDNPTYKLAFSDEFDGDEVDDSKWYTRVRGTSVWNRFIADDPRVAYLEDGNLVLLTIPNDDLESDDVAMLSGVKQTSKSYGLLHGYVEVRAKTTPHTGNFPAIWMMPMDQSDGWPVCGEIDIWETIDAANTAYQTVHSNWTYNLGNTSSPQNSTSETYNMDGEWHTYGLLKESDKLTWYVDGTEVFSYAKSTSDDAIDNGQWPFDKEFYLILNQSVGNGSWASNYDGTFTYMTRFDWARIYEYDEDANALRPVSASGGYVADDTYYDLAGRAYTTPRGKGVYIQNNHKILFK